MVLPHDITVIIKDVKKGTAFKKGHIIKTEDIDVLKRLGKDNIYVLSLTQDEIHENEAAVILAKSLSGDPLISSNQKIQDRSQKWQEENDQYPKDLFTSIEIIHQSRD